MASKPLVSLILCVKDGMPYLPEAVASAAAQTYRDFELVVQDGASTDGSLEFLRGVRDVPRVNIESGRDGGIGDAYNRALRRCGGTLVGSIDSDNLLEKDALEVAVGLIGDNPGCAAVYGSSKLIDAAGNVTGVFRPGPFDYLDLLTCDLVPPFAVGFFNRPVCGDALHFEPTLKTCADFDLWLRLSHLPIVYSPHCLGSTRISSKSMTCRPEDYEQYCKDKLSALDRHFARDGEGPLARSARRHAAAGIYAWAAESICRIEGPTPRFEQYAARARDTVRGGARMDHQTTRHKLLEAEAQQRHVRDAFQTSLESWQEQLRAVEGRLGEAQAALEATRARLREKQREAAELRQRLHDSTLAGVLDRLRSVKRWLRRAG